MTPEELQAIQTRCEAATKGEWTWNGEAIVRLEASPTKRRPGRILSYPIVTAILEGDGFHEGATIYAGDDDIAFIAHARQDIPALLAEVTRLRGLVEAAYDEGFNDGRADERGRNWKSGMFVDSNAKRQLEGL